MNSIPENTELTKKLVDLQLFYKNDCANNSLNRLQIGTIVYREISMAFAFESTSGQWTCSTENWMSAILSHSPGVLSALIEDHFFSEPGTINDHCPAPNLLAQRETRFPFDSHSFSMSLDPQDMSLNIDMNIILPVKFCGLAKSLNNKLLTSLLSCNVLNPGKTFHSKSIVWSPPLLTACVCDWCRVRVLVRLSHPRPPDRNQHGCTVGVLPGPTRGLPVPRQLASVAERQLMLC